MLQKQKKTKQKKQRNGKVNEFKENTGAIPLATLVLPISTTCIHEVYDDKKYMHSIGLIKRSLHTGTYPGKSVKSFFDQQVCWHHFTIVYPYHVVP